ncbi:MAG TPA: prepilin-type N-terminal cleavage/methylation domain-containing protein [Candidatus Sulfotelmatobacter sp.]|nr:prepilin-type N-terminal cleavage/methylation domain-containing protein [Candidatus Sulfotelmatobacter sp.]
MKFSIANCQLPVCRGGRCGESWKLEVGNFKLRRAFTLIEIMIVVAIIGMVAAMGLPSIIKAVQKEGMRKAVSDITDVCASARAKAIWTQQPVAVVFHPLPEDRSFEVQGGGEGHSSTYVHAGKLPPGVDIAMLDIEQLDYGASKDSYVWFFPNGTANEMTMVLHDKSDWRKITTEFATGMTHVSDVDR